MTTKAFNDKKLLRSLQGSSQGRPYLREMVDVSGAAIDEFESAPWRFESKAALLQADLSDGSLARLMCVALMPMHAGDPHVSPSGGNVRAEVELIATRRFYRAVAYLLDDLDKQNKKAADYKKNAMWHENFATKIDELPQEDVDPEMVKYGNATATKLRSIAQSLRGVPVELNAAAAGLDVRVALITGAARPGRRIPPTYAFATSNSAEINAKQADAVAKDALQRDKVWSSMAEDRRQVRRQMREKFKVDFDAIQ